MTHKAVNMRETISEVAAERRYKVKLCENESGRWHAYITLPPDQAGNWQPGHSEFADTRDKALERAQAWVEWHRNAPPEEVIEL